MNNTISVYELLGLIKDGKAPKKIKYEYSIYELTSERNDYYCKQEMRWFTNEINSLGVLNDKVEILEEDKPIIEKIKRYEFKENGITISEQPSIIEIADKLNEVIDCINRREDK